MDQRKAILSEDQLKLKGQPKGHQRPRNSLTTNLRARLTTSTRTNLRARPLTSTRTNLWARLMTSTRTNLITILRTSHMPTQLQYKTAIHTVYVRVYFCYTVYVRVYLPVLDLGSTKPTAAKSSSLVLACTRK